MRYSSQKNVSRVDGSRGRCEHRMGLGMSRLPEFARCTQYDGAHTQALTGLRSTAEVSLSTEAVFGGEAALELARPGGA